MLTRSRLKEVLSYSPDTGEFTWLVFRGGTSRPGSRAGVLNGNGYRRVNVDGVKYYEHRLAWLYMTGAWPKNQIDHINGNRGDNRFGNLREATPHENARNTTIRRHNTSGVLGVTFDKARGKWKAQITFCGKPICIGRFDDKEAAGKAYEDAKSRLHGTFRRL